MRAAFVLLAVLSSTFVTAHNSHNTVRHSRHSRSNLLTGKSLQKRCPGRSNKVITSVCARIIYLKTACQFVTSSSSTEPTSTSTWSSATSTSAASATSSKSSSHGHHKSGSGKSGSDKSGSDKDSGDDDSSDNDSGDEQDSSSGLAGLFEGSGQCGKSGATRKITATSGPMGSIDFFNCGIDDGGWAPPDIYLSDLEYVSLDDAIKVDGSPFKACADYVDAFNKYGEYNAKFTSIQQSLKSTP